MLKRTVASFPGSMTCSGGARRVHAVAEYGPFGTALSNCGAPSLDRSQSVTLARTRTGSFPALPNVIPCVVVLPGPAVDIDAQRCDLHRDLRGGCGREQDCRKRHRHGALSVKRTVWV